MRLSVAAALCCLCTITFAADHARASIRKDLNIPAGDLSPALQTLAKDYDFQVLYRTELVSNVRTTGAAGALTSEEALARVLSGTGLAYKYLDPQTVTITAAPSSGAAAPVSDNADRSSAGDAGGGKKSSQGFRVAQVGQGATSSDVSVARSDESGSRHDSAGLGEIVVTAQRRSQNLQDVGIAVTALSGAELRSLNVSSTTQLAQYTPGLFISASGGGQDSQFTIRGVTQNDFNEVAESPVAVYVDDTYVPNLSGQTFSLFDIKRVEILKGPQGTLFGRNATGGLVQFVVNEPTRDTEAFADVTYGSNQQVKVESAISGPIAGELLGRASIYYDRYDPDYKNHYPEGLVAGAGGPDGPGYAPFGQDEGNDNTVAGRFQLEYNFEGGLKVRATASVARKDLSTAPINEIPLIATADAQGNETNSVRGGAADDFGYVPLTGHDISVGFARSRGNITNAYDGAIHIDDRLGEINFTSVTDYKYNSSTHETDVATGPTDVLGVEQPQTTTSVSQELRFSGTAGALDWTTGAYYLDRLTHNTFAFSIQPNSLLANIYNSGADGAFPTSFGRFEDHSVSLFGQGEYAIDSQWKAIAGIRGVEEYQRYDYSSEAYLGEGDPYAPTNQNPLVALSAPYSNERTEPLWTGKVQLEYRPVEQTLLYAEVNRGVKAGGYNLFPNLTPTTIDPSTFAYKPEVLVDYEGGLKTTVGIATINLSAFYYHYVDYQAFRFAGLSGTTVNDPATFRGGEADVTLRPIGGLQMRIQASAVHDRVKDVEITPTITRTVQPSFTPQAQAGVLVSYRFPQTVFGGSIEYGAEAHYTSSFYTDLRNFEGQKANGYFLASTHLGWTDRSGRFNASINVDNLFDKLYEITAFDFGTFCGCGEISYGPPRWISGRVAYKY